jgi:hypothetical protein
MKTASLGSSLWEQWISSATSLDTFAYRNQPSKDFHDNAELV